MARDEWQGAAIGPVIGGCFREVRCGAKFIEYPDGDHAFWTGDVEALTGDIEEFITVTVTGRWTRLSGYSLLFSLRISWTPRERLPNLVIRHGGGCSTITIRLRDRRSRSIAER